ncbi:rhodanese-like domain-containing protein [Aquimarina hainanensis]|uniref:Rhodanese-like domain-containing protein n=1 Tax=Aquimarina hainanensis TaxID=1578017 RepID=A0ABW5NDD2_9FLAO|nr:rhodanese-like domain-containing protein [Aquimarina sp. TRL1]QKX03457.1 rhodanese-like domain-containing protein [Aquimarina sp. TRL1]
MNLRFFPTILLCLLLVNCNTTPQKDTAVIKVISVEEMTSLLEAEKVQLIDVRTPREYASGHIEGAINIDVNDKDFEKKIQQIDKSKPVAVYCKRGRRSNKCATYMEKAGYTKVYDLKGGLTKWTYEGKPVLMKE